MKSRWKNQIVQDFKSLLVFNYFCSSFTGKTDHIGTEFKSKCSYYLTVAAFTDGIKELVLKLFLTQNSFNYSFVIVHKCPPLHAVKMSNDLG